jgi:hypothetical protein
MTHKKEKSTEFSCFEVLDSGYSLLRTEGFSCSLDVLYGGLRISKLQFLIKKIKFKLPAVNFFSILGHQTLDPDPESDTQLEKCWIRIRIAGRQFNYDSCGSATPLEGI